MNMGESPRPAAAKSPAQRCARFIRSVYLNQPLSFYLMQSQLLEEASKVITIPQVLVNVISQRVRQLVQGHRSLVEVQPRMGFADIALTEVIEGKLSYELTTADVAEGSSPRIVELPALTSRKKAA